MNREQVLIVDLGNCDEEETQRLLGSLIVTGLEQAARSRKNQTVRPPFYCFIDEFQDFCSNDGGEKSFSRILSECRKYGLFLHIAHQTLGQLGERIASALGNVGIKAVFVVDREDAEILAKKIFFVDTYASSMMLSQLPNCHSMIHFPSSGKTRSPQSCG
jgi:type IV secretory pathway TraG/TraD family ATPase VirD4